MTRLNAEAKPMEDQQTKERPSTGLSSLPVAFIAPAMAADAATAYQTYSLTNPLKAQTIPQFIGRGTTIFTGIVGSIALLMFIYGGLLMLTSRGNSEQIQKGKNIFIWATIGLVVIFTAYIVLRNVFKVIGAND